MESIIIDKVWINDHEYLINNIKDRLLNQELRLVILFNDQIEIRRSIKIHTNDTFTDKDVKIKSSSQTIIGKGHIISSNNGELVLTNLKIYLGNGIYTNNVNDLFINGDEDKKEIYKKGLFTYYYNYLIKFLEYNNTAHSYKKMSAVISYEIARDMFNDLKYNVAPNNSFIKNCSIEFDLIILNNNMNKSYVYNLGNVKYIVELKASGFIGSIKYFKDYITFIDRANEDDEVIVCELQNKQIYLSMFEHQENYNTILKVIKETNKKEIILSIKPTKDNYHFYIPNNYNLKEIL